MVLRFLFSSLLLFLPLVSFAQTTHTIKVPIDQTNCQVTGLPESEELLIYPNPADQWLYVSIPNDLERPQIISTTGQSWTPTYAPTQGRIAIDELPNGVYVLRYYRISTTQYYTYKFYKQ